MGQAESRQEQFWEACGFGHTERVRLFIEEGIDVNWTSKTHDSNPIHVASQGKPDIVRMLIDAGCEVNVRDERDCSALHHAAMNGFTDCAKLLIEAGAVVNVQDKNKWTPLHCAAYWGHPGVVELLIQKKADISIVNKDNRTALHEAARSKSKDECSVGQVAELLISAGSDVEARAGTDGFSDFTVLMSASYHGHVTVVRNLLLARCEVNAQSSNDWTALHWAADRSHLNIVELLLENGADPSLLGSRSESAKDRAISEDVQAVFERFAYSMNVSEPSLQTDVETVQKIPSTEVDEDNLPDIEDFPEHLQAPVESSTVSETGESLVVEKATPAQPEVKQDTAEDTPLTSECHDTDKPETTNLVENAVENTTPDDEVKVVDEHMPGDSSPADD